MSRNKIKNKKMKSFLDFKKRLTGVLKNVNSLDAIKSMELALGREMTEEEKKAVEEIASETLP